jgi:predicted transposase YbfD/YdcC
VIGVKKNQPKLYHQIETIFENNEFVTSSMTEIVRNKGRTELRHVRVSETIDKIDKAWKDLCQIIAVERFTKYKNKTTIEMSYYVSNKKTNAWEYLIGIRSHWGIEMGLHYVKDVTLKEDDSKIVTDNAPSNISLLKSASINIIRKAGYKYITTGLRLFCNDIAKILNSMLI